MAKRFGADAYVRFAVEEWMGASPVYSLRMQRAMNFEGDDVSGRPRADEAGRLRHARVVGRGCPARFPGFEDR